MASLENMARLEDTERLEHSYAPDPDRPVVLRGAALLPPSRLSHSWLPDSSLPDSPLAMASLLQPPSPGPATTATSLLKAASLPSSTPWVWARTAFPQHLEHKYR